MIGIQLVHRMEPTIPLEPAPKTMLDTTIVQLILLHRHHLQEVAIPIHHHHILQIEATHIHLRVRRGQITMKEVVALILRVVPEVHHRAVGVIRREVEVPLEVALQGQAHPEAQEGKIIYKVTN